jgi:autoinducer-2 kinase
VSATSMREGIVLYDQNGKEVFAVANVDARADEEVRFLKETFTGIEEEFYAASGQTFALGALPRLLWLKNNRPQTYAQVHALSMISDWILFRLSGVLATDPSNGGTTGIFSLQNRDWQSDMAQRVGLKSDIFAPCVETGTSIGFVLADAAKKSGLAATTQVVMGGGDAQLGSAGLGIVDAGDAAILGGSFWQQVVNIQSDTVPPQDISVRINPHVIPGLSQAEGITFFSGLVMRWFRDAFCELEKQEAKERGMDAYAVLEEKAQNVPAGSNGIIPIFSDAMHYGRWYHAAPSFLNLPLDPLTCNRAAMFRSLQENAAVVSSINLQAIERFTGIRIEELVFAGGASKGKLWPQIVADVTGRRVKIPKVTEATALGTAMAAGVGVGIYADMKSAAQMLVQWERAYEPNPQNRAVYDALSEKFQKAYKLQLDLVDAGVTTSMWKAPGL